MGFGRRMARKHVRMKQEERKAALYELSLQIRSLLLGLSWILLHSKYLCWLSCSWFLPREMLTAQPWQITQLAFMIPQKCAMRGNKRREWLTRGWVVWWWICFWSRNAVRRPEEWHCSTSLWMSENFVTVKCIPPRVIHKLHCVMKRVGLSGAFHVQLSCNPKSYEFICLFWACKVD